MAVNENQKKSQTQGNRKPWVLLLVVIIIYGLWSFFGWGKLVWGNLLYSQTGNVDLLNPQSYSSRDNKTTGLVLDGLGSMMFYSFMVVGLVVRKKAFRILAYIDSGLKIFYFGLLFTAHLSCVIIGEHATSSFTTGIGDVALFQIKDGWGCLVFGILLLLSVFSIYVLSRRDVRELFRTTKDATTTPAPAPSSPGDTP